MRSNGNYIENPGAYNAAISRRIKANANVTRARKLEATIAGDSEDFRAWLFNSMPERIRALGEIAGRAIDERGDDASRAEQKAYHNALADWRKTFGYPAEFLSAALRDWGGLTDGQLAFARKSFAERVTRNAEHAARDAERKANAAPWQAGRQTITGVVQSARWESYTVNRFASTSSLKALILLSDGRKIWTTIPAALRPDENSAENIKGQTVTFTVTVEVSKDDTTMAFGKRPTA